MTTEFMSQINEQTAQAFSAPKVGDRFEEFCSVWMIVLRVDNDGILVWQRGCDLEDKFIHYEPVEKIQNAYSTNGEYWMKYFDSVPSFAGNLLGAYAKQLD